MEVKIIHTGSAGNCAVIDDTLIIDAGWKVNVKGIAVLLTHHHTDHMKYLDALTGLQVYAIQYTIETLRRNMKYAYMVFNEIEDEKFYKVLSDTHEYVFRPVKVNHDVPCVGYDITRRDFDGMESKRIFFATDFNTLTDEARFVKNLKDKVYDAIYIEANNTLCAGDFMDVYFNDDEIVKLPKDEFHRRRSFQTHCNVDYLISLFRRAGYSPENRFTEPVTLLHKSSTYYAYNPERVVELCKMVKIVNPIN